MRRRVTAPGARPNQVTDLMTQVYGPFLSLVQAREQGLKQYFTGKACVHGHISVRRVSQNTCLACKKIRADNDYKNPKNKARIIAAGKRRTKKDMEQRRNEPAFKVKRNRQCREAAARRLDKNRVYSRELYQNNIQRRLKTLLQVRLRRALLDQNAEKSESTAKSLGCSMKKLSSHFEALFTPGMTWENIGEWHIDHIRPCASFDLTDPKQKKKCFNYKNLQPLWAKDNLEKSAKWSPDPNCGSAGLVSA